GADGSAADAEAILVATEALAAVGIGGLSVDLNMPTLVTAVAQARGLTREHGKALVAALDRRDAAECRRIVGNDALIDGLLDVPGDAATALPRLRALDLPEAAAASRDELLAVVAALQAAAPELSLTIDPLE